MVLCSGFYLFYPLHGLQQFHLNRPIQRPATALWRAWAWGRRPLAHGQPGYTRRTHKERLTWSYLVVTLAVKTPHWKTPMTGEVWDHQTCQGQQPQHTHTSYIRRQGGEKTSPYPQKLPWTLVSDSHLCVNQLLL